MKLGDHKLFVVNRGSVHGGCGAYSVAAAERIDIEESKDLVTLKELQGWDVSYRQLALASSRRMI